MGPVPRPTSLGTRPTPLGARPTSLGAVSPRWNRRSERLQGREERHSSPIQTTRPGWRTIQTEEVEGRVPTSVDVCRHRLDSPHDVPSLRRPSGPSSVVQGSSGSPFRRRLQSVVGGFGGRGRSRRTAPVRGRRFRRQGEDQEDGSSPWSAVSAPGGGVGRGRSPDPFLGSRRGDRNRALGREVLGRLRWRTAPLRRTRQGVESFLPGSVTRHFSPAVIYPRGPHWTRWTDGGLGGPEVYLSLRVLGRSV